MIDHDDKRAVISGVSSIDGTDDFQENGVFVDLETGEYSRFQIPMGGSASRFLADCRHFDRPRLAVQDLSSDTTDVYRIDSRMGLAEVLSTFSTPSHISESVLANGQFLILFSDAEILISNIDRESSEPVSRQAPRDVDRVIVSPNSPHIAVAFVVDEDQPVYLCQLWSIDEFGQSSTVCELNSHNWPHFFNDKLYFVSEDRTQLRSVDLETGNVSEVASLDFIEEKREPATYHWFDGHLLDVIKKDENNAFDLLNERWILRNRNVSISAMDHELTRHQTVSYTADRIIVCDPTGVYEIGVEKNRVADVALYDESTIAVSNFRSLASTDIIDWKSGEVVRSVSPFGWLPWAYAIFAATFFAWYFCWTKVTADINSRWYLDAVVFILPAFSLASIRVWDGQLLLTGASSLHWFGFATAIPICFFIEGRRRKLRWSSYVLTGVLVLGLTLWVWTNAIEALSYGIWILCPLISAVLIAVAMLFVVIEREIDDGESVEIESAKMGKLPFRFSIYDLVACTAAVACVIAGGKYLGDWYSVYSGADYPIGLREDVALSFVVFATLAIGCIIPLGDRLSNRVIGRVVTLLAMIAAVIVFYYLIKDFYCPAFRHGIHSAFAFLCIGPTLTMIVCMSLRRRGYRMRTIWG